MEITVTRKDGKSERIFFANHKSIFSPVDLDISRTYSKMLLHIRDEAHRFSRKLHHKEEKKRLLGF